MLNIGGPDCKNISFENTYVAGISFAKLDDPISDFKHKLDAAAGVICMKETSSMGISSTTPKQRCAC